MKGVPAYLLDTMRGFYPFLVCIMGGGLFAVSFAIDGPVKFMLWLIAMLAWCWALDAVSELAAAKARGEETEKLITALLSGEDTTIDVNIRDERYSRKQEFRSTPPRGRRQRIRGMINTYAMFRSTPPRGRRLWHDGD